MSVGLAVAAVIGGGVLSGCGYDTDTEQRAQKLLARMTVEEKIGQIIQGDISSVTPEDAREYNLGSVLNGGNSAPGGGKTASWQQWIDLADAYWLASTDTSDGGVSIPLIWGTDAVHGHNNLQMATIFPHNSALGATADADLLRRIGEVTAAEVRATGLDWAFAPTLAVAQDDRWGRTYESYSEDPAMVSKLGAALIEGLQGLKGRFGQSDFLGPAQVVATAKHFVGDGGTQFGIDKGDTIMSLDELKKRHAFPYKAAIKRQVQTVMASFSSVNGVKMHGAQNLLTGLLRDEMGFDGFVIGDWNGHAEIPGCTPTDCPAALLAGVDMYMAPDSWKGLYHSLHAQVQNGTIPEARLDEAVLRILRVKIRAGLMDAGLPSKRPATKLAVLGKDAHRQVAREAVRKSLVLLKNANQLLPINPKQKIVVVGTAAHSMAQQTGGWTLSWQGDDNRNEEFETGETIYDGLRRIVTAAGGDISWVQNAAAISGAPDVAIFVFGETPYAEFKGDITDLVYEFSDGADLATLAHLRKMDVPVVSLFLTGRPLWVNPHINQSDAFVVGWLPGTEGGAIADVVLRTHQGAVNYDFTGRLSFSWPADGRGQPIERSTKSRVQFPFGYGLSYAAGEEAHLPTLSENPQVAQLDKDFKGALIIRGTAVKPMRFYIGDASNGKTPADSLTVATLGGALTSRGVDYKAQEDSRQLSWSGDVAASASVQSQRPIALAKLGPVTQLALHVTYRLDQSVETPVMVTMGCGEQCGGTLDVAAQLRAKGTGHWQNLLVPVHCFVAKGLDATAVTTPFQISTSSALALSLHAVKLTRIDQNLSCP